MSRLVSITEMLQKAKEGKYAVGQFNINNLEWTQAVLTAAQEANSPIILGVSEGAGKYMGGPTVVSAMVNALLDSMDITVPVALHLDHGSSVEVCKQYIDAGFSSVMFDHSHFPIDENIALTKEVVAYAHPKNVSVEAEVGTVGGTEDGVTGGIKYADLEECKRMVSEGQIDALAAALGSVHGTYSGEPVLGFDEMLAISEATGAPLVLHGGSGIPTDQIQKAISLGVSKVNVNTECQLAFAEATRKYIEEGGDQKPKGFDPRKLLNPGFEAIKAMVHEKIDIFGSRNKA